MIDFETFLDLYDDDLYAMYMENGLNYENVDREEFDEEQYENYCNRRGVWAKSP